MRDRLRKSNGLRSLRAALARRFLLKIKRATHRAPAQLIQPRAEQVLVIAPHMDDEVIGCGGTLCLLRDQGAAIHVIFASDSSAELSDAAEAAKFTALRRGEASAVASQMGFASVTELGFPDGHLHRHESELAEAFFKQVNEKKPDLIFCPFPADGHSDHMSCASALAVAAVKAKCKSSILAYEIWTPLWPNVAVDISSTADRKQRAIQLYMSQQADRDYSSAALGLNRYRGLAHAVAHAEAFHRADPEQFQRLCSLLDEI